MACYCQGLSVAADEGTLEYNFYQASVARSHCSTLTSFDTLGTGLSAASAALLAVVNTVLGTVILWLVGFERHTSHSAKHRSQYALPCCFAQPCLLSIANALPLHRLAKCHLHCCAWTAHLQACESRQCRIHDQTAGVACRCVKMAVAQYLNTSITPLLASAEIKWLAVAFGGVIFDYGYPDFTTNWCAEFTL